MDTTRDFQKRVMDVFSVDLEKAQPLHVSGEFILSAVSKEAKPYIRMVKPRDLHHLKDLMGVPNQVHEANGVTGAESWPEKVHPGQIPPRKDFSELGGAEATQVRALARNLLLGHVSDDVLSHPTVKAVVAHMLELGRAIPVAAAQDVTVADGQVLVLDNTSLVCNTLTMYGSGTVDCRGTTKITANRVVSIPNPA